MNEIKWSAFAVSDFFDIFTGSDLILSRTNKGKIPVVTHQEGNNGISMFAEELSRPLLDHEDTISLADRGTFKAYTQPTDFYIGTRVKALKFKDNPVTENILLFLTTVINAQQKLFSYGYNATNNVGRINIMLPVDSEGNPNWTYMEEFVENQRAIKKDKVVKYLEDSLKEIVDLDLVSLDNVKWASFRLEDFFTTIQRGKRLTKTNQVKGDTPYISSTAFNNGVDNFIDEKKSANNRPFDKGIAIANSGSVGTTTYHPYRFVASDHVTVLWNENLNEYSAMFVMSCLKMIATKYSFNREMNDDRLKNDRIMLPVNDNNEPDFDFMESYIKQSKKEQIEKAFDFLKNR